MGCPGGGIEGAQECPASRGASSAKPGCSAFCWLVRRQNPLHLPGSTALFQETLDTLSVAQQLRSWQCNLTTRKLITRWPPSRLASTSTMPTSSCPSFSFKISFCTRAAAHVHTRLCFALKIWPFRPSYRPSNAILQGCTLTTFTPPR